MAKDLFTKSLEDHIFEQATMNMAMQRNAYNAGVEEGRRQVLAELNKDMKEYHERVEREVESEKNAQGCWCLKCGEQVVCDHHKDEGHHSSLCQNCI